MIAIVNGYLCKDLTEAALAIQGKDPLAPAGAPPYSTGREHKIPAVTLPPVPIVDRALQVLMATSPILDMAGGTGMPPTAADAAPSVDATPLQTAGSPGAPVAEVYHNTAPDSLAGASAEAAASPAAAHVDIVA